MRGLRKWLIGFLAVAAVGVVILAVAKHHLIFAKQGHGHTEAGGSLTPASELRAFDPGIIDRSANACTNLYQFADGEWMKKNPVPPQYPRWGRFDELQENNRQELRGILEQAARDKNVPQGSNRQKIGDFYASCMDTKTVEAEGAKPLEPEFERIEALHDVKSLEAEISRLQSLGVNAVFNFGSTQDEKNSSQVIAGAEQGGLGLPDRDYYTKTDAKSKKLRADYEQHVAKMLELLGDPSIRAAAEAATILKMETRLAEASMTRVERRDPEKTYHKMDVAQLHELTSNFSWPDYFREVGQTNIVAVDVAQPEFFQTVNQMLTTFSLSDWKTYLRWCLLHTAAPALSSKFVDENFNFYGRELQGTKELLPRWQRCVRATDSELGFALGKIYVQKYFPPEAKRRADQMVHNLMAALRDDIKTLPWMSPETKKAALAKLDAFTLKIGYPTKWRDYSAYHVTRGPYVENFLHGNLFDFHRDLNKIGQPVDRTEWEMTPPTVNAYYDQQKNEIVFPAGILQPPFFDPKADDAVNYGGMGAVIGHEMTHGFDDQGRKFDAQGNLKNWWTPEDLKRFQKRAECVEKQFDSYVAVDDLHENGKLVLGESIADLGGVTIAYKAFKKTPEGEANAPKIEGFTPDQRFFISFAQVWASNTRPQFARMLLTVDPHPLNPLRAIAAPSNMPAFAKAFGCKQGDAMVRPEASRCQIW